MGHKTDVWLAIASLSLLIASCASPNERRFEKDSFEQNRAGGKSKDQIEETQKVQAQVPVLDDVASGFIAQMDAMPPEKQVPHWEKVRSLMMRPAPRVGELAPDFALKTLGDGETVRLSEFRSKQPVVLIFGSWT